VLSTILAAESEGNGFWLPHDINEVIWGTIAFVIVVGVIVWKGGPAIKTAMAARPERISGELSAATDALSAAEAKRDDIKSALADSDSEAARIVAEAHETAERLTAEIIERAHVEAASVRSRALVDIESSRRQATTDLTHDISRLALGAAEQVVHNNLDDTTQQSLIEAYIAQVGSSN